MVENVSFMEIPADIRVPGQYIEIDSSQAVQGLPSIERKILVVGQRLPEGTVEEKMPTRVPSGPLGETYFGRGSQLAAMLNAVKAANRTTDVWAIALDDNVAGVEAAGSIAFAGAVTAAGTLKFYIGGTLVDIAVAAAESGDVTATNLVAAITEQNDLPVVAAVNGVIPEQVDITARHKGEVDNDLDLRVNYFQGEFLPTGLTVTIVAMSGGTANPDISDAITVMGDVQYYTIISPWTDDSNMIAIETEMDVRWGPIDTKTGHVFVSVRGSLSEQTTWGTARNSVHTSAIGVYDSPTSPWIWAAVYAAITEFNGQIDPARQFTTLSLPGLLPPPAESRLPWADRNTLLHNGIGTFVVDSGGVVHIEYVITTYQQSAAGVDDTAFLALNTKWTVDFLRSAVRTRIALRYPRHKLADDGTRFSPGQVVATPSKIRGTLLGLFRELETAGLVERFEQFKEDLIVVRSNTDPDRVNSVIPPDIINNFRIFAAAVQFRL